MQRRNILHAAGMTLGLPWFESLARAKETISPKRFCTIYFPYGVSLPSKNQADEADWHWFPQGEGREFTFNKSLQVLEPFREHLTVLG
ncbi:MAG: DUF1552 domain-containing protein, partial [Verrucomicrobiota bacterium]